MVRSVRSEIDIYNLCCVIVSGVVGRAGAVAVLCWFGFKISPEKQKKYILTDIKKEYTLKLISAYSKKY